MKAFGQRLCITVGIAVGVALLASQGPSAPVAAAPATTQYRTLLPTSDGRGYVVVGADGSIAAFGDATDLGHVTGHLSQPVVGAARLPGGAGYWLVARDGGVFPFGAAVGRGSTGGIHLNQPVVGMASTPSGNGYWLVASDGGVFPFGDARGYGSTGGIHLNQPIVGMASTRSGNGYWLVASDGGIFPFGDAGGYGSTGGIHLSQPVVGMASTLSGNGYWLVASDGGIFPFGDAGGYGSTGGIHLNRPVVGMAATPSEHGYWLVAGDGGIFPMGDASGFGSMAAAPAAAPVTTGWTPGSLHSADGVLNVGVSVYSDCTGTTPLTRTEAALDTCLPSVRWYFVGHNPGPFTPILQEGVGSVITYVDASGTAHPFRIVASRDRQWYSGIAPPQPVSSQVVTEFQTCLNAAGTLDRILDAVPA